MAPVFQRLFAAEEEVERPKAAKEAVERSSEDADAKDRVSGQEAEQVTSVVTQSPVRESPSGLIPASKLPSAADALAELFAEAPATEKPRADEIAAQPEKVSELKIEEPAADGAPKRRGIFARLLTFKRPPATTPEKLIPSEEDGSDETPAVTLAEAAPEVGAKAETKARTEAAAEAKPQGFDKNAGPDFAVAKGMPELPIPAETLPSAADDFEKIFLSEKTFAQAATDALTEVRDESQEKVHRPEPSEASSEVRVEALVEVGGNFVAEATVAERVRTPAASDESARIDSGVTFRTDTRHGTDVKPVEAPVEAQRGSARLGSNEAQWPYESPYPAASEPKIREHASEKAAQIPEDALRTTPAEKPEELVAPNASAPETPQRLYKEWAFDEKLASHREWVESHGLTRPARRSFRR